MGNSNFKACCLFCGATVGETSERTGEIVTAIYDCPKCMVNFCDQCSHKKIIDEKSVQMCLRCDSDLDKVL